MTDEIRVLIVGTGGMARSHANALSAIEGVSIVAGVDTSAERLAAFQAAHDIPHGFASLDEAIAWGEFDAATNVTPDAVHYATTMPLIAAGKHVMCEKPLATNHAHAIEMADAAERAGIVNMVNLTYRRGPALIEAARMVRDGLIGEVRHFEASYLQSWLTQPAWGEWDKESQWLWRLSTAHGSAGALGDVGVHILDFATLVAGALPSDLSCRLTTFDKAPGNRIGDYVLDANDSFNMHMTLENGAAGVVHGSRFASGHLNDLSLQIFGTRGGLEVRDTHHVSTLRGSLGDDMLSGTWKDIETSAVPGNFETFIAAIRGTAKADPDFRRGADLQKVLDLAIRSDAENSIRLAV